MPPQPHSRDGERVDLVPALRRLLATVDPAELDALEHDFTDAEDVLPVVLGDRPARLQRAS
jgi:hypothetical protein